MKQIVTGALPLQNSTQGFVETNKQTNGLKKPKTRQTKTNTNDQINREVTQRGWGSTSGTGQH